MIGQPNHVAIVVPDLDSAAVTYRDALGAWEIASLRSP
jgi:catechol 2,3-dioxygenase-like lactoylglutathione lyase family enzyme